MTVKQQSRIPSSVYKLAVFAVVTVVLIGLLATLIGNISFVPSRTYYAMFADATGVNKGDRVRLSGVEVGVVKGFELVESGDTQLAKLEFTVEDSVPIYRDAELELRYENIVGQRYLAIEESPDSDQQMRTEGTFPAEQTTPALNLTVLFNGFQPLFRALEPEQLNEFSFELVRALQGEATSLQSLMADTAELTNSIADRDQVIGSVVTNLNSVLETVGRRDEKLTDLIVQFRNLMSGLAEDRDVIDASLPQLASLLGGTVDVIDAVRRPLKSNIASLNVLAGQLYDDRKILDASIKHTPFKLRALARTGSYGSWFNFYICGLELRLQLLDGTVNLGTPTLASNERDTVCSGGIE
jgi:phospholipid/cholesterol/gamma-HCH transport system substrate-binding protein